MLIAFAGIVTAKVDAAFGTIVGKALEPLASGVGTIRVLVMPRWAISCVACRERHATPITTQIPLTSSTPNPR